MNARRLVATAASLVIASCSGSTATTQHPVVAAQHTAPATHATAQPPPAAPHESPPVPGPRHEIHLPTIARSTLPNGLEVDLVEYHALPVLHLRLVARSAGSSADPAEIPGLASFTGDMLKEGVRGRTSAQIAESIEFVGGTLEITTTADETVISVDVLKDHADTAFALLADLVAQPTFPQIEIDKLRRREVDRLTESRQDPSWLSRQVFYREVYGAAHPYGHYDTTPEALHRITRADLVAFHHARFVAGSMFLVVVGDTHAADLAPLLAHTLATVRRGTAPAIHFPTAPARTTRQVIIVDRADSAQSVIRIGNLSLARNSEDYVPLSVANQVLGGEASSRLFMDLRERRSLTYGAYSRLAANVDAGTFQAIGSVRTPVTAEALGAFFEHLDRIAHEPPPEAELAGARDFLVDQFPLTIATPGDVANLIVDLRLYQLPDTYWDTYRERIAQVTPALSLAAAQRYIQPDHAVIVLVGSASTFEHDAQHYGPVRVVDLAGRTLRELPMVPATPAAHAGG